MAISFKFINEMKQTHPGIEKRKEYYLKETVFNLSGILMIN